MSKLGVSIGGQRGPSLFGCLIKALGWNPSFNAAFDFESFFIALGHTRHDRRSTPSIGVVWVQQEVDLHGVMLVHPDLGKVKLGVRLHVRSICVDGFWEPSSHVLGRIIGWLPGRNAHRDGRSRLSPSRRGLRHRRRVHGVPFPLSWCLFYAPSSSRGGPPFGFIYQRSVLW